KPIQLLPPNKTLRRSSGGVGWF
ncbi:uncharacterized protein METZ01_LOCUS461911, partial [marine metagenome]